MSTITITSVVELISAINDNEKLHVCGSGTKTSLLRDDMPTVQLSGLSGIMEYLPDEYTITVRAGTPVAFIQEQLAEYGQYLPFDPMLAITATIGGTVATNLSGSRRFRYGGVRDFILGANVVDGQGRAFRVGGKVVKNAAGFDLTKFLVGSLGRYAIMTDITFKVFPDVPTFTTLKLTYETLNDLLTAIYYLNQSVFELDALDFVLHENEWQLWARMTGQNATLTERVERLTKSLSENTKLIDFAEIRGDNSFWDAHNSLLWAESQTVVKVPISPKRIPELHQQIEPITTKQHYAVGGNIAWLATDSLSELDAILAQQDLTGLCILGATDKPILGKPIDNVLADRVKAILNRDNKFI